MSRRSSTGSRATPIAAERLHFDVFSGIAGNMVLGALLDLGLPRRVLEGDLAGLGVEYVLKVSRVKRGALCGRYVDVRVPAPKGRLRRGRSASAGHAHGASPGHGRSLGTISRQIEKAKLAPEVRDRALEVFLALGRAEAKVHGTTLQKVHFHEVGAVDALVDIVGSCIGVHRLGVNSMTSSPVALGKGLVETAHGRLPLPAPATLELLKGIPTVPADVEWETVTPTGAALLKVFVDEFRSLPEMTIDAVGYGAGQDRAGPMPNLLRVVSGHRAGGGRDRVVVLEADLDELALDHLDHLMKTLHAAGALDVGLQHLSREKKRPGFVVRVLGQPHDRVALAQILFSESVATGVRVSEWDRLVFSRKEKRITTPYGRIRVKILGGGDVPVMLSPEYSDCRRAARKHDVSFREILRVAEETLAETFEADRA